MTLVSVITPTWQRRDVLLGRCIPSVAAQTYPQVEHVVVCDGPHPDLKAELDGLVVVATLDDGPHGDWGSAARNHGLTLAEGDLVAYLDDDNAWRPDHLERLVAALDANPDADFAWSRMRCHPHGYEVGGPPPAYGNLDSSLLIHRRGLPQRCGMWPRPGEFGGDQHAPDWGVVARWLNTGARWTFVDHVTVDYYFAGH